MFYSRLSMLSILLMPSTLLMADPQLVDVAAQIRIVESGAPKGGAHQAAPPVVIWLSPVSSEVHAAVAPASVDRYRMAQKNKSFEPKLLVVPIGSVVEFPNLDPFFHNVFSQFNGKRFDLGLYEAGTTKGVRFDHEGVSYLFCNIHPEMAAVIVTLSTPYFATTSDNGKALIHQVPAGNYDLHVWTEGADPKSLDALTHRVSVAPAQGDLGTIEIVTSGTAAPHKNKFGEEYPPAPTPY